MRLLEVGAVELFSRYLDDTVRVYFARFRIDGTNLQISGEPKIQVFGNLYMYTREGNWVLDCISGLAWVVPRCLVIFQDRFYADFKYPLQHGDALNFHVGIQRQRLDRNTSARSHILATTSNMQKRRHPHAWGKGSPSLGRYARIITHVRHGFTSPQYCI